MHRRASHAILMHRKGFRTSHRGCAASQRVAGPYDSLEEYCGPHTASSVFLILVLTLEKTVAPDAHKYTLTIVAYNHIWGMDYVTSIVILSIGDRLNGTSA